MAGRARAVGSSGVHLMEVYGIGRQGKLQRREEKKEITYPVLSRANLPKILVQPRDKIMCSSKVDMISGWMLKGTCGSSSRVPQWARMGIHDGKKRGALRGARGVNERSAGRGCR